MGRVPLPSTLAILPEGKSQSKQTQKKSAIFMTPWAFSPEPSSSHALYDAVSKKETMRTYNALGNITQEILSSCQIIDDGRYEYDLDGNLIFDGEWHYTYDTQNRLITLENKNKRIECEYDSFHRRLSKKVFANGQVKHERYLWDGDNEIGVMNEQGQIEQLRILGEGLGAEIGAAVLYELKGKAYIPIHDHRGCVVTLIDMESKQPLESYRYTAFGEELTKNETFKVGRFAAKSDSQLFSYTNTAAKHMDEVVMHGSNTGRLARPYMRSPLTVQEIMATSKGIPDLTAKGALNYRVPGTFRGSKGIWELVIDPNKNLIYHFNFIK